jgi:hypothetical protein
LPFSKSISEEEAALTRCEGLSIAVPFLELSNIDGKLGLKTPAPSFSCKRPDLLPPKLLAGATNAAAAQHLWGGGGGGGKGLNEVDEAEWIIDSLAHETSSRDTDDTHSSQGVESSAIARKSKAPLQEQRKLKIKGKKKEKKTQSNSLQRKGNHGASKDLHRQQQNQQIQNRNKPKAAANSKRTCAAGGKKNRGRNPGPQS